jgi:hypothetical protein
MNPTFVVYIDESGDEGFSFGQGSSEWFILSAVTTRKAKDLETVKLVDQVRALLGKPEKKPLHFRDIKHEQRLPYVDAITNADLRAVCVLIHKPSVSEPDRSAERYWLYFCGVGLLLERVSWCCRDYRPLDDRGDGPAELVFSNRAEMSYATLRNYLDLLKAQSGISDVRVEWSVISPDLITVFTPGKRMGLQIADAVASSFYYAVQPSRHGFTEDRYARMLKPVVYRRQGQHLGYGLKFWPEETENLLETENIFGWARDCYR